MAGAGIIDSDRAHSDTTAFRPFHPAITMPGASMLAGHLTVHACVDDVY
jgi:hypothetical protein